MSTAETPIQINSNLTPAQVKTFIRYFLTLAAPFLPKLTAGWFSPDIHDMLLSDEFAAVVGLFVGGVMTAWGMADTYIHRKLLVAAANAAPDSKFVVDGGK